MEAQVLQSVNTIQFMQGFFGIPIKVPDGMIEVEENVTVFFDFGFRIWNFRFAKHHNKATVIISKLKIRNSNQIFSPNDKSPASPNPGTI